MLSSLSVKWILMIFFTVFGIWAVYRKSHNSTSPAGSRDYYPVPNYTYNKMIRLFEQWKSPSRKSDLIQTDDCTTAICKQRRIQRVKKNEDNDDLPSSRERCLKLFPILKNTRELNSMLTTLITNKRRNVPSRFIESHRKIQDYANYIDFNCHNMVRIGNEGDGGWSMCLDHPFKPINPCLIYSFGVGGDWSFDDSAATRFDCEVHSFDPTIRLGEHIRKGKIHFHPIGLKHVTNLDKPFYMKLQDIMSHLNHSDRIIDFLKFDIETWEWPVMRSLLSGSDHFIVPGTKRNGRLTFKDPYETFLKKLPTFFLNEKSNSPNFLIDKVKQLVGEFHLYGKTSLNEMFTILESLKRLGFLMYYTKPNVHRINQIGPFIHFNSYEMHFINFKFIAS